MDRIFWYFLRKVIPKNKHLTKVPIDFYCKWKVHYRHSAASQNEWILNEWALNFMWNKSLNQIYHYQISLTTHIANLGIWPWNQRLFNCSFNVHFSLYPLPGSGSCQVTLVSAQKRPRFSPPWGVRMSPQRAIPAHADP